MPFTLTTILPTGNQVGEVGTMLEHPSQSSSKPGKLLQEFRFERLYGEEWNQSYHRADFQRRALAVGQIQHVVVKLVLVAPEADALVTDVVHGLGNVEEVLEELRRDVLVNHVVLR